jgi:hypothetical protein
MLKYTTARVVTVQDWDKLVRQTYGKPYRLQQQDGCMDRQQIRISIPEDDQDFENLEIPFEINGSEMGINFQVWLNTSVEEMNSKFEDSWGGECFWERNFYPDLQTIANDLHAKGLIEPGEYLINIDW